MASVVAEIEKTIQNKFLSEELNIETKLHHLSLSSQPKSEIGQTDPEEERNRENQAALKRNKDLLKETDLVVARYRSRSLYSPVDGHLEAWKLKYLKQLKELKHKERLRRFPQPPEPESVNSAIGGRTAAEVHPLLQRVHETTGILRNGGRSVAYVVAEPDKPTPSPLPRRTRGYMSGVEQPAHSSKRTPASASLFRTTPGIAPVTANVEPSRQKRCTPVSADPNRATVLSNAISQEIDTKKSHMENFGPPLDYSFKGLTTIDTLKNEKPRKGVKTYKKSSGGRYSCTSLRLNNNFLDNIIGIHSVCLQLLEFPEKLTWLDLSFNKLTSVAPEIAELQSLKILYLHGNILVDLPSVLKTLKALDGLYSLTLHGNPLEERKGYRNRVIASLPYLKSLDFNNVTLADRKRIAALQHKKKSPNGH